jgi:hypothetical protein
MTASQGGIFFIDFDIIDVNDADPTLSLAGARQGGDFSFAFGLTTSLRQRPPLS